MSYSSLWLIDKNYIGREQDIFSNSWLFSPIIWDILSEKYLPKDRFGFRQSIIGYNGKNTWCKINDIMNNSDNYYERICWEMSNEAIFFSKDKKIVSKAIRDFLGKNNQYHKDENGVPILRCNHIVDRWNEIASVLENIAEKESPYFVFKNTSVDDTVSSWFEKYNEDTDEWDEVPITSKEEMLTEFVIIDGDNIVDFIPSNKIIDFEVESEDKYADSN